MTKTKTILLGVLVFIVVVIGSVGAVAAGVAIGRRFAAPPYGKLGALFAQRVPPRVGPMYAQPVPPQPGRGVPFAQQYARRHRLAQQFATRRGFALGEKRGFFGADTLEAVANALGMKPADVTSALRSGKTLTDFAKQQNVDESKIKMAIADAEKATLDRAVKDGFVTQERADALKAKIDPSKVDLNRRPFGPGHFQHPFGKR